MEGNRNLEADNVAIVRVSSLKCKQFLTLEGHKLGRQSMECRYHLSSSRLSSTCPSHFRRNYGRCTNAVMFAAASNEGLNCIGVAYTARDPRVICINSAHYNGGESDDNPDPSGGQNLSTLGENVTSA